LISEKLLIRPLEKENCSLTKENKKGKVVKDGCLRNLKKSTTKKGGLKIPLLQKV